MSKQWSYNKSTVTFFREYLSKDNIRFLTDLKPEQVYYRQKVTYIFEPEMSVGPLDDMITTVNIIGVVR